MAVPEPCIYWPVWLTEAQPVLRVVTAGVGRDATLDIDADDLMHYVHEDDLLAIVLDALNSLAGGVTWTGTISADHVVQLVASGTAELLWAHANTTLDPRILGWTTASVGPGTTFTAPNQAQGRWRPGTDADPRGFLEDTRDEATTAAVVTRTLDGAAYGYDLSPETHERLVSWYRISEARVLESQVAATEPYSAFETAWTIGGMASAAPFRLCDDLTDPDTYTTYTVTRAGGNAWTLDPDMSLGRLYTIEPGRLVEVL